MKANDKLSVYGDLTTLRKELDQARPQTSVSKQPGVAYFFPAASPEPKVVSPPALTREEIKQAAKEGAEESFSEFLLGLLLGLFLGHHK